MRYGGGMVNRINDEAITYRDGPTMFEAGTPNIEGVLAFSAAVRYIKNVGVPSIAQRLRILEQYAWQRLSQLDSLRFPFPRHPAEHTPIFTFRPQSEICDLAFLAHTLSDSYQIALSYGYQCCQPLYDWRGVAGAIRVSLYFYNTEDEIDALIGALEELRPFLA